MTCIQEEEVQEVYVCCGGGAGLCRDVSGVDGVFGEAPYSTSFLSDETM